MHSLAEILKLGFSDYLKGSGKQPYEHYKVANDIMSCRTSEQGGHIHKCDTCDNKVIMYNSCSNRHCPQCQTLARVQWVNQRIEELLPVPYFHAVFTIPNELNPFFLRNKSVCYSMLFNAVNDTLAALSYDKKHLGARTGYILILHTWGQNLMDHPHIHCIIPGGGLNGSTTWKKCREKFLFPVPVMRKLFKGKLMSAFRKAFEDKRILLSGDISEYGDAEKFKHLKSKLYEKEWVVYVKEPFGSPEAVVKYLGNYTHRIAISNKRILSVKNGVVSFSWKDYNDGNKNKIMTLKITEFIRRFFLHVVPKKFMRIRHYGILGNRCKGKLLELCRQLITGNEPEEKNEPYEDKKEKKWFEILQELTGKDPRVCPVCGVGIMQAIAEIARSRKQKTISVGTA